MSDGPPTSSTYSPFNGVAAGAWRTRSKPRRMRSRSNRFIAKWWEQYLCWRRTPCKWQEVLAFIPNEILGRLALPNERKTVALHQHFGRQRPRIVIRRHGEPIGAGAHQGQEFALVHRRQLAILSEKIAALADRTDNIDRLARLVARFADRHNLVVTLVERGPNEIVHAGVHDHEFLLRGLLEITDAGEQDTGVAHEESTGLEQHPQADLAQRRDDRGGVVSDRQGQRHCLGESIFLRPPIAAATGERGFVNNPDPAADTEKLERILLLQFLDQRRDFRDRFRKGRGICDLRADVHLDAANGKVRQPGGLLVDRGHVIQPDTEFVFAPPGGDVTMSSGIDVGIYPERDRRLDAFAPRNAIDPLQLRFALDVETQDAFGERILDFFA